MRELITPLLTAKRIFSHDNKGVLVCSVKNPDEGTVLAKEIFYQTVDKKTLFYLSGGHTPQALYEQLAKEEIIIPGAVGLSDERYGLPMHEKSNERMIAESGLVRYFSFLDIPYYSILKGLPIQETAERYDELIRSLQTIYRKTVGIFGIGVDGHTAGIAPNRKDFKNPLFGDTLLRFHPDHELKGEGNQDYSLFGWFNDDKGSLKERVTMTFLGISMLDFLVILVFGDNKKEALNLMFESGSEEDVPARFYLRSDIAKKTILITDQQF